MLIIDVKMLSGFVPVKSSLDKVNLEGQGEITPHRDGGENQRHG